MKKLREVIDFLSYEELEKIKRDLDSGGFHLKQFIEEKISKREEHNAKCYICSNDISPDSFKLIFGKEHLKKELSFCALDCLDYFLLMLKQLKRVRQ